MTKQLRLLMMLATLFGAFMASRAQEPSSLTVTEGKVWDYVTYHPAYGGPRFEKGFHFEGTETLDGKEYAVFRNGEGNPLAYMRQDGDKIYLNTQDFYIQDWWEEDELGLSQATEHLLYDFSLKVGDRFRTIGFDDDEGFVVEAEVTATYEVENEGRTRRVQEYAVVAYGPDFTLNPSEPDAVVVEGIGPNYGYLYAPNTVTVITHVPTAIFPLEVWSDKGDLLWLTDARSVADLLTFTNKMVNLEFVWEYRTTVEDGDVDFRMRFDDLYLVDGKYYLNFHTLSHTLQPQDGGEAQEVPYPDEAMYLLREEDDKVYMRVRDYSCFPWLATWYEGADEADPRDKEYLLYDFSLKAGEGADIITTHGVTEMTLESMTQLEGYPQMNKWTYTDPDGVTFSAARGFGNLSEGTLATIGLNRMADTPDSKSAVYPTPDGNTHLVKILNYKGETVWENTADNGVEAIEAVESADDAIYDLHGRRVVNPQPGSIYICGGRKFVGR